MFQESEATGLNAAHRWLRLPVSVPNGNLWTSTYYVLMTLHTLFVLAGLVVIVPMAFSTLDSPRASYLQHCSWFWYVTTAIWLSIFPLLYLI